MSLFASKFYNFIRGKTTCCTSSLFLMKTISLFRQVNIEDIAELTPRRGSVIVTVQINKPPQLEEVDQKIEQLVDMLTVLEQNLDSLEQDYFQDVPGEDIEMTNEDEVDDTWKALHKEYDEEIGDKDEEYEALLKRFNIKSENK